MKSRNRRRAKARKKERKKVVYKNMYYKFRNALTVIHFYTVMYGLQAINWLYDQTWRPS